MKNCCTQNSGDCLTCSLVNYGRECINQSINTAMRKHCIERDALLDEAESARLDGDFHTAQELERKALEL